MRISDWSSDVCSSDLDDRVILAAKVARHREAEAGRDRGRAVRRAEGVVDALLAAGESGEAAALAQGADAVAPAGEDLVRIALMRDVPAQLVRRRLQPVVQRGSQLDTAKAGTKVAAANRHGLDHIQASLSSEERRVVKEYARQCNHRWYPNH